MARRQRLLSLDASSRTDAIEIAALQFLARRTQGLSDEAFVLMLRRLSAVAATIAQAAEMALMNREEL